MKRKSARRNPRRRVRPEPILFLSDARGVYIPRDFAQSIDHDSVTGIDKDVWEILEAGPDHEFYWEAWDEIERDAVVTDQDGVKYGVYQDGDCFLIPHGMEWDEETGGFAWPT